MGLYSSVAVAAVIADSLVRSIFQPVRMTTGLAFLLGLVVACWLASLDRKHWLDRYSISLQVERSTKGDKQ